MSADALVVAGTDTGVGKTVLSAMLTLGLSGIYWKPVQTGTGGDSDTAAVRRLTGLPADRFLPERYSFKAPLSPHRAAELEGASIDPAALGSLPETGRPLIVETAGGLLVPLTRSLLQIDFLTRWGAPVILAVRTSLGTINHSLLSLEALARRDIPLLGVVFVGERNEDNERSILEFSHAKSLGRLPRLDPIEPKTLARSFRDHIDQTNFRGLVHV